MDKRVDPLGICRRGWGLVNPFSKSLVVTLALGAILLNASILLVAIPTMSRYLDYNGNQYADGYDEIARNLVLGDGYRFRPDTARTLQREPGYPILLAGIFIAFGENLTVVKVVNMLLALGTTLLMTRIARRVSSSKLLILGAPLLFFFHPGTLIAESRGGTEILFAFCLSLLILTIYRAVERGRWWDYVVSGAVLGLTVLVRSTPILFPLLVLCYLFVFYRKTNSMAVACRNVFVMAITMLVVQSPWIVRNYRLTGKFVPTASVLGVAAQTGFYLSTHHPIGNLHIDREAAWERNRLADELGYQFKPGYYQYFYSSIDEVNFSHYLFKRVMAEYERSPKLFVKVVGINLFNFWCGGRTWKAVAMNAVIQLPLLFLAIIGIILSARAGESKRVAPLGLLIVYIVAISVPILALARYSVPLIPFLSILAGITLVEAQKRFNSRRFNAGIKEVNLLEQPCIS